MPSQVRDQLRSLPALTGTPPHFDVHSAPDDPIELFLAWLDDAVSSGTPEPHAMTLSTVDAEGVPDARTLILKDVDARGWAFASTRSSRKARQLAKTPAAALSFWWQPSMRAIRVQGRVEEASPADAAEDLAMRSPAARAAVSEGDWVLWRVVPERVEFWQGAVDRQHVRLIYRHGPGGWTRQTGGDG
jgi:pyridoxamine 5'-phosphate oxidase